MSLSRDHVAAFVLHPVAADRTRIECLLLFHPDACAEAAFDPSDAFDFWHMPASSERRACSSNAIIFAITYASTMRGLMSFALGVREC